MKIWKATAAAIAFTAIGSMGAMAQDTTTNSRRDAESASGDTFDDGAVERRFKLRRKRRQFSSRNSSRPEYERERATGYV